MADLPLTDEHGATVDLASFRGKTVMLVPFLTLCTDICPLDTGNLLQVERALRDDRAAANVQLIELSIDPERDTPARLAAYSRLTGASWELVTESPAEALRFEHFFGWAVQRVAEDTPPFHRLVDEPAPDLRHQPFRRLHRYRREGDREVLHGCRS